MDFEPKRRKKRRRGRSRVRDASTAARKTGMLCRQIQRALDLTLAASDNPMLSTLRVAAVCPAPDISRLVVELVNDARQVDPATVRPHLKRAEGWLRTSVAASIHRRKVPSLSYML